MHLFKIFIFVVIGLAFGIRSASQVTNELKELTERIERTNRMLDSILWESDHRIDSMTQNTKFIGFDPPVADSLTKLLDHTSKLLTRLKNELINASNLGGNLIAAENLVIKTPKGDSLYNYMMQVYDTGIKYGDSTSGDRYRRFKKYTKDNWLNLYFKEVPTYAAITILSKFRDDLIQVKSALMAADIQAMKNRMLSEAQ